MLCLFIVALCLVCVVTQYDVCVCVMLLFLFVHVCCVVICWVDIDFGLSLVQLF